MTNIEKLQALVNRFQVSLPYYKDTKLIVGVLSKEPMYVLDTDDTLIASGGTAGYCAISKKADSPYAFVKVMILKKSTIKVTG